MSKNKSDGTIIRLDGTAVSFVLSSIFAKHSQPIDKRSTDLLVIDHHKHMHMGGALNELDTALDGMISKAVAEHQFDGTLGDHFVINQPDAAIKNILVVGVGKPGQSSRPTLCGFLRLVLETARRLKARRITIPIFPGRLQEISLSGTMAVLRCRVAQFASDPDGLGDLKEIEILSTPQARRWIAEGLSVTKPLCSSCSNPRITPLKIN